MAGWYSRRELELFSRRERIAPQVSSDASMRVVFDSGSKCCSVGVGALAAPLVGSGDGVATGVVVWVAVCMLLSALPGSCDGSSSTRPGLVLTLRIVNSTFVGLVWFC